MLCSISIAAPLRIFFAPLFTSQTIKDYQLALFVCALVVVDVVILLVYTLVEGLRGNLTPIRVTSAENPSYTLWVSKYQSELQLLV